MSYEPKNGEGSLFQNKSRRNDKDPSYRGYFILPSGEVIGVAMWKNDTKNGVILSLKYDERETLYRAKTLKLPAFGTSDWPAPKQTREANGFGSGKNAKADAPDEIDFDDEIPF